MLCKIGIRDWIKENSYTGSSESGYDTTGHAKMCLKCGLIVTTGTAQLDKAFSKHTPGNLYIVGLTNGNDEASSVMISVAFTVDY